MRSGVFHYTTRSFLRAERAGVFGDRKVELIEGIPYVTSTNPPHNYTVLRMAKLLRGLFPDDRWTVAEEKMIEIGSSSCPIPDVLVLAGPMEDYKARKFEPGDIRLLVEVADSSWSKDRNKKLAVYAEAGIPECWFVRLRKRCVYRFTEPVGDAYATHALFEESDRIPIGGATLAVTDLLP